MIEYNIIKKRFIADKFGLQKGVYGALEKSLIDAVKKALFPYEDKLKDYHVTVNLDLNESKMNISSKDIPDDLHQELEETLKHLPEILQN